MITKVLQSNDLRATLDYVYQESKTPEVVDGTCLRSSKEGAYDDIKMAIELRPEIKKPVFHAVLSLPEHEQINDHTWKKIASEYTERMGFGDVPYVAVRHQDTDHPHIHIVASRIKLDGQLISDSFEAYRSQEVARSLEKQHGLTPVPSSWEVDRRRTRPEDLHRSLRLGEPVQRERMQAAIAASLQRTRGVDQFVNDLSRQGVRVVPNLTRDERKVQGISFERDGVKISGSKIDRQYSWNRLKNTLDFEHERDVQALKKAPDALSLSTAASPPEPRKSIDLSPSMPVAPPEARRPASFTEKRAIVSPQEERVDASSRMARALEQAPYDRGWRAWSRAIRDQGVEPIAKVTQHDSSKLRGMYFQAEGVTLPGSHVDRRYSIAQLTERLGPYDEARDHGTFSRVMVPGVGVQPLTTTSTPSASKLSVVMKELAQDGWQVERNPKHFEGTLDRVIEERDGQRVALLRGLDDSKRIAALDLQESTRYVKAVREADQLRPVQKHDDITAFEPHTRLVWRQEKAHQVLLSVSSSSPSLASTPRAEVQAAKEQMHTTWLKRLEEGGYRVQHEPSSFEGKWGATTRAPDGTTYGVILSARDGERTLALIKLDEREECIRAQRAAESQRLLPEAKLRGVDELERGQEVVWRAQGARRVLIGVTPSPTLPSRESTSPAALPASREAWQQAQAHKGLRVHELSPGEAISGTLHKTPVKLKEGDFHVLETRQQGVLLVPRTEQSDASAGQRTMVRARQDGSLILTSLERSRDTGRSR